ncbi:DUF885 family protein [Sphingomonas sp.]|uniref:DUF885 family protein n=1 Tax=Sphingomonas sp. TaxID=28214 RepID=UPI002FDB460B
MIALSRRSLLAGTAATLVFPARASGMHEADQQALRAILDRASADPAAALAALSRWDATDLPAGPRLDLLAARSGLAIDIELARRFPFGRPGRSPYRITPGSGAWLHADGSEQAITLETQALRADAALGVRLPRGLAERTATAVEAAQRAAAGPRAATLGEQLAVLRRLAVDAPAPGVAALPDGHRYYVLLLRRTSGDDVDAEALRHRLIREHAAVCAKADRLFAQIGQRGGSIGARYQSLWQDSRWRYPDDAAGRDRAVADMNRVLATADKHLPLWFDPLPAQVHTVRAARMSAAEEAAGKQGYRSLPEGARPGRYVVDLREIGRRPAWTLPAVVHHELLPGHMVQMPLETLAAPHPLRLDYAQSFVEGWAIYAEGLAAAAGLYRGDPHGALGYCHWRLFRLCRALADLNIHLHGWSIDEALAFWRENMGEPAYFAPFDSDLDRIVLEPATRAAEAASWLAIEDLARGRAPRPFHRALLQHGRMRTDMLRGSNARAG